MPIASPFHERTQALCSSYRWKDWAGYHAVCRYDHAHEPEYYAFRQSAGLIDVTPLFKYDVRGSDAAAMLSRMMVRDIGKLQVGRVTYCCWCDDRGKVIDDGTVSRLEEGHFRVTAAEPTWHWLLDLSRGFDVTLEDSTTRLAALALQGPSSREILKQCGDAALDELGFFRLTRAKVDGLDVCITRTGYTGDLGYELWVENAGALQVWDALMAAGQDFGIRPAGLDALDMTRIEAGFVMLGVDYFSAKRVVLESRKSTPYEIGLGWAVDLDREGFVGQAALQAEQQHGPGWQLVGLEVDWAELETLYDSYGLPAHLPAQACRDAVPVLSGGRQVGQATSHTWSPMLKKQISLASVRTPFSRKGTRLQIEHTVEFERRTATATVVETPFFDPGRKRKP